MKLHRLIPVLFALWISLASSPSSASPDAQSGPVLRIHGGFGFQTGNRSSDQGIGGGASLGVPIGKANLVSLDAGLDYFPVTHTDEFNKARVIPVTLNAEHHFPMGGRQVSWVGAGAGLYHLEDRYSAPSEVVQNAFGANAAVGVTSPMAGSTTLGFFVKLHYIWGKMIERWPGYMDDTDMAFITAHAVLGFGL